MIVKVNLSKKENYYTQRNNKKYPFSSCGVTSMINALCASNIPFTIPKDIQPEDYLSNMLEGTEAYKIAEIKAPKLLVQGYPPRLIHVMLEWAVNKLVGYQADTFIEHASIQTMIYNLWVNKNACIVDGKFTKDGHIVCVVGFTYEHGMNANWRPRSYSDIILNRIQSIIIDDSYGNYFSGYIDQRGNDIEFDLETFNKLTNKFGDAYDKRMHILRRQ
ncbi:MAG: hypothetical protein WC346_11325 [Methanogenium sp.]|jgi:hypothetical protein